MLMYRGEEVHARDCSCCSLMSDAARPASRRDPTGTGTIRRAFKTAMATRINTVRKVLRAQVINQDILGLRPLSSTRFVGGSSRVSAFQAFVDQLLSQTYLESDGSYVRQYLTRASEKGRRFGERKAGPSDRSDDRERVETMVKLTFVELQGIAEATSQNLVRVAATSILGKVTPERAARDMTKRLVKVGIARSKVLSEFIIVRAFNEATLDAYQEAGVSAVGLIPESRKATRVGDARRVGPGSRGSRFEPPSRRTVQRIRRVEQTIETRLSQVNVETAGDELVCPQCQDLEENGPYSINRARNLIPAHPHCRCVFVPAEE